MAHSVYKYRKGEVYAHCYKYPQTGVTADCIVFSFTGKVLQVLLIKRGGEPFKDCWAFPGGFINPDETVDQGAARELMEETSLKVEYMEQIKVFSAPDRDPRQRVMTVPFLCLTRNTQVAGGDDAAQACWFPVDELPLLAFDHKAIFNEAMKSLRRSLYLDPVAFYLLPEKFTLPQLRRLYEIVLGRKLDRRNFARKMRTMGILEFQGVGDSSQESQSRDKKLPSRIASLFSFNKNEWKSI